MSDTVINASKDSNSSYYSIESVIEGQPINIQALTKDDKVYLKSVDTNKATEIINRYVVDPSFIVDTLNNKWIEVNYNDFNIKFDNEKSNSNDQRQFLNLSADLDVESVNRVENEGDEEKFAVALINNPLDSLNE